MILKYIISFLVFTFALCKVESQTILKHYTTDNGLISNTIYASLNAKNGFLWFSSEEGVTRFDGNEFLHYTTDDGLPDNEVLKIFEDSAGRIWLLCYNGKAAVIYQNRIFTDANYPPLQRLNNTTFFTAMIEDKQGGLWFFKEYQNLFYYTDLKTVKKLTLPPGNIFLQQFIYEDKLYICYYSKNEKKGWNYCLAEPGQWDKPVCTWVSTNQLYAITPFNDQIYFMAMEEHSLRWNYFVSSNIDLSDSVLLKDQLGNGSKSYFQDVTSNAIYFSNDSGIVIYENATNSMRLMLAGNFVTSICNDFEGGKWISTKSNGIFQLSTTSEQNFCGVNEPVYEIYQNPFAEEEIYMAANRSLILFQNNEAKRIELPSWFTPNEPITDIAFLSKNKLIISNGNGICSLNDGVFEMLPAKSGVKQMIVIDDSILFARSSDAIIQHKSQLFEPQDGNQKPYRLLNHERTLCAQNISPDSIYCGDNQGAFCIQLKSGLIARIPQINVRIKEIIYHDPFIVFSSDLAGIYIKQGNDIVHVTTANGLISNNVNGMMIDSTFHLWVATSKGLSSINLLDQKLVNYDHRDGLPFDQINDVILWGKTDLLLSTPSGPLVYTPKTFEGKKPPRLELEYVKIDGRDQPIENTYELRHHENSLEIKLNGISFSDEPAFYYSLNEHSKEWIRAGSNTLHFVNMPIGEHSLTMRCKSGSNNWSNEIKLHIMVRVPYYETTGFKILFVSLLIGGFIVAFIWIQLRKSRKRQIDLMLSETRQKALQAQLNPHFVFNALNSIQYLFMSKKTEEANDYLNRFSVLLRNILKHSDKTLIPLFEEIENLKLYLDIEQKRTNYNFQYEIAIQPELDIYQASIQPMLLQPFIENSIWHGFKKVTQGGVIKVEFLTHEVSGFEVTISDNGSGFNAAETNHINGASGRQSRGINLIRDRINALNNMSSQKINFSIYSDNSGTRVHFHFPNLF